MSSQKNRQQRFNEVRRGIVEHTEILEYLADCDEFGISELETYFKKCEQYASMPGYAKKTKNTMLAQCASIGKQLRALLANGHGVKLQNLAKSLLEFREDEIPDDFPALAKQYQQRAQKAMAKLTDM
jgi:hypothetical protein